MTHIITLTGYNAHTAAPLMLGTWGSYGIERLQITPGAGWEGLTLTATFHPPGGEPVRMLVPADGLLAVPPEATAKPKNGGYGQGRKPGA